MKKKLFIKLMIALLIITTGWDVSWAESLSFSVSCTIPAIPGVNAPPFPKETAIKTEATTIVQQETKTQQEEPKTESPSMIQEDTEEGTKLVKTIYAR